MGTLDSVACTSAISAWWKVRGGNFAEPLMVVVFGSEALPGDWCTTELATLTKILTLTASPPERSRSAQCRSDHMDSVATRHGLLLVTRT